MNLPSSAYGGQKSPSGRVGGRAGSRRGVYEEDGFVTLEGTYGEIYACSWSQLQPELLSSNRTMSWLPSPSPPRALGWKTDSSLLGQYGEELVAEAFGGAVAGFDTKAYDVRTPQDGDLQVKTFSVGKRPGNIRSFTHDVVTVEIDPATARVVSARRYAAAGLFAAFQAKYIDRYVALGMAWGGAQADRFERGWSIPPGHQSTDITHMFR